MKKPRILILKNIKHEGPGQVEEVLKNHGIAFDSMELEPPFVIPDLNAYAALMVFGGPDSVNDKTTKMHCELETIQAALKKRLPYLGICLGMQALAKAAGGEVYRHNMKEVGFCDPEGKFFEVKLTEKGRHDPLFAGLGQTLPVFQLHGETVGLTPEIELLAEGKHCRNQAIKVGTNAYGLQCHFELTEKMFEEWFREDADLKKLPYEKLRADYEKIKAAYEKTGHLLVENFLKQAALLPSH